LTNTNSWHLLKTGTFCLSDWIEEHDTVGLNKNHGRFRNICLTLPFPCKTIPWHVCENAREQAKLRWSWFANAKQVDKIRATDLGTLNYLPWELRRQILTALIPQPSVDKPELDFNNWAFRPLGAALRRLCHLDRSIQATIVRRDSGFSFPHFHDDAGFTSRFDELEQSGQRGRFELRPYFATHEPRFNRDNTLYLYSAIVEDDVVDTFSGGAIINVRPISRCSFELTASGATIINVRQASGNLKEELDGAFLSTHNFFLDSPEMFELFCKSPMVLHAQRQGRISITLPILSIYHYEEASENARMERWYAVLESLPSNLKSLAIYLRYRRKTPNRWRKHFQKLDMILNKAKRHAPGAKITIGLTYVHESKDNLWSPDMSEDAMVRGIRNLTKD